MYHKQQINGPPKHCKLNKIHSVAIASKATMFYVKKTYKKIKEKQNPKNKENCEKNS